MSHSHETLDWADLVRIEGRFDSEAAEEIQAAILERLEDGAPAVLVDLSGVTLLASAGLRALLVATKEASRRDRHCVLVAPTPAARRVLQISRLDAVLDVADELDEARELVAGEAAS